MGTVLITGASRGIGRACALKMAELGLDVAVNYHCNAQQADQVVQEVRSRGRKALAIQANVASEDDVKKMFDKVAQHFGHLDVLVNNAGTAVDALLLVQSSASLMESIDTNLKGVFYCTKQAGLMMVPQKRGKIINMSSISSGLAIAGQSAYSATKGAIESLTRVLAIEYAKFGIQVNAVAPGFIDTDMTSRFSERKRKEYEDGIPFKRFGAADEVAAVVAFLCSDAASYIQGQVIAVDGGLSIRGI